MLCDVQVRTTDAWMDPGLITLFSYYMLPLHSEHNF